MSELLPTLLLQALYYLPSVLAHMAVLGLSAWVFGRNRGAGAALATGTALQLLASLASYSTTAMTMSAVQSGWSMSSISGVASVVGLGAGLLRAVGELVVAGGVYLAVAANVAPARPEDPYGYGRG